MKIDLLLIFVVLIKISLLDKRRKGLINFPYLINVTSVINLELLKTAIKMDANSKVMCFVQQF